MHRTACCGPSEVRLVVSEPELIKAATCFGPVTRVFSAGAGEGNRTLMTSLEGCGPALAWGSLAAVGVSTV